MMRLKTRMLKKRQMLVNQQLEQVFTMHPIHPPIVMYWLMLLSSTQSLIHSKLVTHFTGVAIKHEHGGPIDLLNLWKSVPPRSTQFLDLEAKHDSDDDSGISTSESGDLTPGFISDNDDCVSKADDNTADMNVLAEMLPVTARRVREVHGKRQRL